MHTVDQSPLFALQAWAPVPQLETLGRYARDRGLVMEVADPSADDEPPTLFENPPPLRADHEMLDHLGINATCPYEVDIPGGWWPDVLPEH